MKRKINISALLIVLFFLLLIFRYEVIWQSLFLIINFVELLFSTPKEAVNLFDLRTFDYFLSTILIIALPAAAALLKYYKYDFGVSLSFTNLFLIILLSILLLAPVITDEHPDFQKDIRVTKLLPPLSRVKMIKLKSAIPENENMVENYLLQKNKVVKKEYTETVIYCDSLSVGKNIVVYQKGKPKNFSRSKVEHLNGTPVVSGKLYLFGTDEFGRDIFTRIIFGTRVSVLIGAGAVLVTIFIGILFGAIAGMYGGFADRILSRLTDTFLAFPIIFLVVLVIGLFGNNIWSIILVLGFSGWMSLFKIVKSELVSLKNKDYFLTARMIGLKNSQLLFKEIIPVIAVPVLVNVIFQFGNVILAESALSYLGLGLGSEFPSWGAMIQSGQGYISTAWWMIFFPGVTLMITLLAAKNIGDNFNKLLNPKLK